MNRSTAGAVARSEVDSAPGTGGIKAACRLSFFANHFTIPVLPVRFAVFLSKRHLTAKGHNQTSKAFKPDLAQLCSPLNNTLSSGFSLRLVSSGSTASHSRHFPLASLS